MTTGYLTFADQASALARSRAEAQARGCKAGDVTRFWWPVTADPVTAGQWLMLLDDGRVDFAAAKLSAPERATVAAGAAVLSAINTAAQVVQSQADDAT